MWVFRKWKHVSWLSCHNYIWPKASLEQFLANFFCSYFLRWEQGRLWMVFSSHIYRFAVTVYSEFQPNPFAVKSKKVSNPFWTSSGTYYLRFCSWKLLDSHTSMCSIPPHLQGIACISGTSLHNFAICLPVISVFGRACSRNANSHNSHRLLSD